jgi:hypothetical protein
MVVSLESTPMRNEVPMAYRLCTASLAIASAIGAWHHSATVTVVALAFMCVWLALPEIEARRRKT